MYCGSTTTEIIIFQTKDIWDFHTKRLVILENFTEVVSFCSLREYNVCVPK